MEVAAKPHSPGGHPATHSGHAVRLHNRPGLTAQDCHPCHPALLQNPTVTQCSRTRISILRSAARSRRAPVRFGANAALPNVAAGAIGRVARPISSVAGAAGCVTGVAGRVTRATGCVTGATGCASGAASCATRATGRATGVVSCVTGSGSRATGAASCASDAMSCASGPASCATGATSSATGGTGYGAGTPIYGIFGIVPPPVGYRHIEMAQSKGA